MLIGLHKSTNIRSGLYNNFWLPSFSKSDRTTGNCFIFFLEKFLYLIEHSFHLLFKLIIMYIFKTHIALVVDTYCIAVKLDSKAIVYSFVHNWTTFFAVKTNFSYLTVKSKAFIMSTIPSICGSLS